MAEDYIRPPIVASEAPNRRAAIWRFRIYVIIAVALLVVGIVLIFTAVTGNSNDNGVVGGLIQAPHNYFFAGNVRA